MKKDSEEFLLDRAYALAKKKKKKNKKEKVSKVLKKILNNIPITHKEWLDGYWKWRKVKK